MIYDVRTLYVIEANFNSSAKVFGIEFSLIEDTQNCQTYLKEESFGADVQWIYWTPSTAHRVLWTINEVDNWRKCMYAIRFKCWMLVGALYVWSKYFHSYLIWTNIIVNVVIVIVLNYLLVACDEMSVCVSFSYSNANN